MHNTQSTNNTQKMDSIQGTTNNYSIHAFIYSTLNRTDVANRQRKIARMLLKTFGYGVKVNDDAIDKICEFIEDIALEDAPPGIVPDNYAYLYNMYRKIQELHLPVNPHKFISATERATQIIKSFEKAGIKPGHIAVYCDHLYLPVILRRKLLDCGYKNCIITIISDEDLGSYDENLIIAYENYCQKYRSRYSEPPVPEPIANENTYEFHQMRTSQFCSANYYQFDGIYISSKLHNHSDDTKVKILDAAARNIRNSGIVILRGHNVSSYSKGDARVLALIKLYSDIWEMADFIMYSDAGRVSRIIYGNQEAKWKEKNNISLGSSEYTFHRSFKYYDRVLSSKCHTIMYEEPTSRNDLRMFDAVFKKEQI